MLRLLLSFPNIRLRGNLPPNVFESESLPELGRAICALSLLRTLLEYLPAVLSCAREIELNPGEAATYIYFGQRGIGELIGRVVFYDLSPKCLSAGIFWTPSEEARQNIAEKVVQILKENLHSAKPEDVPLLSFFTSPEVIYKILSKNYNFKLVLGEPWLYESTALDLVPIGGEIYENPKLEDIARRYVEPAVKKVLEEYLTENARDIIELLHSMENKVIAYAREYLERLGVLKSR